MKKTTGFSLIEVMIVVPIVAKLAAVAMPAYTDYIMRGKLTEAHSNLAALRTAAEQYFQDNRTYVGFGCAAATVTPKYFTYTCPTLQPTSYQIVATGVYLSRAQLAQKLGIALAREDKPRIKIGSGCCNPKSGCC